MSTLRRIDQLLAAQLVPAAQAAQLTAVAARYSVALTSAVRATIGADPATDPVARQYVPTVQELDTAPGERADPIGDEAHTVLPGLVHRYPDRVLLKATQQCPVYCRFCFRREVVGGNAGRPLNDPQIDAIVGYIAQRPQIWEVILSGGDPLVLSTKRLARVVDGLAAIEHVQVLRVHTRVPVVQPARIDAELIALLRDSGKTPYVVLHANHPNEFSSAARAACARLIDAGIPMLSQSVLLAGINDSSAVLGALMRTFVAQRITPYYLHQLDAAPGTAHFQVPLARGQALLRELRGRYSGLCQPTYVVDVPGGFGKAPVNPTYLESTNDAGGNVMLTDYRGGRHVYPAGSGAPNSIDLTSKA